ncbi:MAG: DUF192 domain-containing protein [Myxococcales bacterium]|nr:DUF192 domain-containing protein [Myxococcales bacterium]
MSRSDPTSLPRPEFNGLLFLALLLASCGATFSAGCRRAPEGPARVFLPSAAGEVAVRVEVVRRPEERERGLMYRRQLDEDAGMLFVYPAEGRLRFWMKNTYLPLDMIFIGDNRRIVGVVKRAAPLTEEGREVDAPARFVLEVNGGFFERHRVQLGGEVRFENVELTAW